MPPAGKQYWIRTEQGRVWGPYQLEALERLRGQLTEKAEASLDGREFHPGMDFPELRLLLGAPRAVAATPPARERPPGERLPTGEMYVGPALRALIGEAAQRKPAEVPQPAAAPAQPPKPAGPPVMRPVAVPQSDRLELSEEGILAEISPVRLYALAALTGASGWLKLHLESGKMISLSFRRGAPDHLSSDDPDLSLLRFLQSRKLLSPEQASQAEEQATRAGVDVVSALFQLQLIPAADAHKLIGEHAVFLLDRALEAGRGRFSFQRDAPSPPGAFPLGQKWVLLAEGVRRLDPAPLRARLGKKLARHVQRSGGSSIGKMEELALTAQETRVYASVDGTRTGEQLIEQHGAAVAVRLLYLLTELKHLSFGEAIEEPRPAPAPEPEPAAPAPAPAPVVPTPAPEAAPKPPAAPRAARPPAPRPTPAAVQQVAPRPAPAAPAAVPVRSYATPPPDETPQAQLARLRGLIAQFEGEKATHFDALGLTRKATVGEVKKAFVLLARELHPDTVTDPTQGELRAAKERLFAMVNEAAQVLGDDAQRKEYEAELEGDKKD